MKNNRLTARVLAVFAAVLLVTVLSVPAFAATSYGFTVFYDNASGDPLHIHSGVLPEGLYYLEFNGIRTSEPINLIYDSNEGLPQCVVNSVFDFGTFSQAATVSVLLNGQFSSSGFEADSTVVGIRIDDQFVPFEGLTFISADSGSIHLTDYISAETLPNVFNEIISLLPIALGVLVGYIAIRKGISYLKSFLHNS